MKTILSALVALSVIAGVAGSASALDAKTFFEQIDRDHNQLLRCRTRPRHPAARHARGSLHQDRLMSVQAQTERVLYRTSRDF